MKCQIQFSGKNKKNIINLSSAENAQRVVKVKPLPNYERERTFHKLNPKMYVDTQTNFLHFPC